MVKFPKFDRPPKIYAVSQTPEPKGLLMVLVCAMIFRMSFTHTFPLKMGFPQPFEFPKIM